MLTFTFPNYDIGNGPIIPSEENPSKLGFIVATERGFMDQTKRTVLTSFGTQDEGLGGAIDYKKKTMEVQGVTSPFAAVKYHVGGTFSS
jgi:hypothetical protein